jgi:glycosyltransferase involved in cell wall biosynthesis
MDPISPGSAIPMTASPLSRRDGTVSDDLPQQAAAVEEPSPRVRDDWRTLDRRRKRPLPRTLTILIPAYNEAATIEECIRRVLAAPKRGLEFDIVVSDNYSTDGTREILGRIRDPRVKVVLREKTSGKGTNIRTALEHATGDIILWQDADLEYNPNDYQDVLEPFLVAEADVVYGSRLAAAKYYRVYGFPNYVANKLLTWTTNALFNRIFTDIETGTKAFRREIIQSLNLVSDGFEVEPEVTAKVCRIPGIAIFEVPISHNARGYDEGKKVRWWHFFTSMWTLLKWRVAR